MHNLSQLYRGPHDVYTIRKGLTINSMLKELSSYFEMNFKLKDKRAHLIEKLGQIVEHSKTIHSPSPCKAIVGLTDNFNSKQAHTNVCFEILY